MRIIVLFIFFITYSDNSFASESTQDLITKAVSLKHQIRKLLTSENIGTKTDEEVGSINGNLYGLLASGKVSAKINSSSKLGIGEHFNITTHFLSNTQKEKFKKLDRYRKNNSDSDISYCYKEIMYWYDTLIENENRFWEVYQPLEKELTDVLTNLEIHYFNSIELDQSLKEKIEALLIWGSNSRVIFNYVDGDYMEPKQNMELFTTNFLYLEFHKLKGQFTGACDDKKSYKFLMDSNNRFPVKKVIRAIY